MRVQERLNRLEQRVPVLNQHDVNKAMPLFARFLESEKYIGSGSEKPLTDEEEKWLLSMIERMKQSHMPSKNLEFVKRGRSGWRPRSK
jgi:hypothetical protein